MASKETHEGTTTAGPLGSLANMTVIPKDDEEREYLEYVRPKAVTHSMDLARKGIFVEPKIFERVMFDYLVETEGDYSRLEFVEAMAEVIVKYGRQIER